MRKIILTLAALQLLEPPLSHRQKHVASAEAPGLVLA